MVIFKVQNNKKIYLDIQILFKVMRIIIDSRVILQIKKDWTFLIVKKIISQCKNPNGPKRHFYI